MSATDELRRLLDERGEEHSDVSGLTLWLKDGNHHSAMAIERINGGISLYFDGLTPEQAIDATLGREKCKNNSVSGNFFCSECECSLCLEDSEYEPTMFVDDVASVPKYCPICGRKVEG